VGRGLGGVGFDAGFNEEREVAGGKTVTENPDHRVRATRSGKGFWEREKSKVRPRKRPKMPRRSSHQDLLSERVGSH